MYLRSLRLKGFKSFPKQTELLFESGVAVVIGPNGSGKSNLSDAVVWVLGEQSPSTLRGSSMQDVIFSGSDGRRASGMAEVELTFDNSDGRLSVPAPEVSVARRVDRDGTSKYFINKSPCRLSDVVELMGGIGLGKETHSIVGQGKVESFLTSKPDDRRAWIEEAAGLGRYKRRRERSQLKLREVRRNLERAGTMEREVTSQLAPLRRQASAAEQMRSVQRDLAEVRARLCVGELDELDGRLAVSQSELHKIADRRQALESELAGIAADRLAEEEQFARRLEERERRAQRLLRARVLAGRMESCARLTEQRLRMLAELGRAAEAEHGRLLAELAGGPEEPGDDSWPLAEARLTESLRTAQADHDAAAAALAEARAQATRRQTDLTIITTRRDNAAARLTRLEERASRCDAELSSLEAEGAVMATGLSAARNELAMAETAAASAEADATAVLHAREEAAEAEQTVGSAAAGADEAYRLSSAERRSLEAQIGHLEATLRELQDVGGDVLEVAAGYPGAVALSSVVKCAPGYERALAAALAQLSGAIAVPQGVDQWSLLDAFRNAGVGLVRLLLSSRQGAAATAFPGAVRLLDKVSVDDVAGLEAELATVVIVDDLRTVPEGFPGLAVTREGAYYRPSASQLGLAAGVPAALLLERRARLDELTSSLAAVRAHELRCEVLGKQARATYQAAAQALDQARREEHAARVAAETAARQAGAVRSSVHDLEEGSARLSRRADALALERAEIATEVKRVTGELSDDLAAAGALAEPQRLADEEVGTRQGEYDDAVGALTRARVELDERRAAARRAADDREHARRRLHEGRARLTELEARLKVLPEVQSACEALAEALQAVQARAGNLVAGLDTGGVDAAGVPDRLTMRELADREAGLRREDDELTESRTACQVAVARLDDRRQELARDLDGFGEILEIAAFEPPADAAEVERLLTMLERLERRRERIGPVNPLAEAECEQLSERAGFFREQRKDLERSITDLEELIGDLTGQIDEDFAETFTAVQEKFGHMVTILFPGGKGSLVLVPPENEGEPGGVAVEVKPARKLGKKLQLLSGGERALVAIAFMMALVLSRPCPFYILDEIEAALDDVNIGRFVALVRDYRERTQFIIITHQKRTMEAADLLYGVTMGPDGGSRVVSARMAEAEIEREEETATRS